MKLRLEAQDRLGNLYYLVVRDGRVSLTTKQGIPLALSNVCDDAQRLTFLLEDLNDDAPELSVEEIKTSALNIVHMKAPSLSKWAVLTVTK